MVAGLAGLVCILAGVAVAYLNVGVEAGNWSLALSAVLVVAVTVAYVKLLPHSPFARLFVSNRVLSAPSSAPTELLGRSGVTETVLRPSGTAIIDGRRVDVRSDGPLIEKGVAIKVVSADGMSVVVSRDTDLD
jgi:membrane-bound serine protease (ClpP class)